MCVVCVNDSRSGQKEEEGTGIPPYHAAGGGGGHTLDKVTGGGRQFHRSVGSKKEGEGYVRLS